MLEQQPRYDSYKDSGIDWIGEVSTEWDVQPLRSIFEFRNEKNDPVQTENILSLSIAHGVTPYSEEGRGGNKRKDDLTAYKLAHPGDIVLNSMNVIVGAVGLSNYFGAISPVYYALKPKPHRANVNFYSYVFQNQSFLSGLLRYGKGIMMKLSGTGKLNTIRMKISTSDLKQVRFPVPDLDTQNRIVKFLDEKTAEIDAAIEKKRRLIDLLNEQKAILINRAVTKGLNPDAPMKDSGVDWIGEIPAHWDVLRNAALFDESKKSGTADLPVLSVSIHHGVSRSELSEEENLRSAVKIADRTSYVEVLPGYIAYNMMRAWQGGIGAVHTHGMVSPAYVVARPKGKMNAEYFERLYRTKLFIDQMDQFSKGITDFRKRLYWEEFKVLLTLVPEVDEQNDIAEFCGEIDDACKDAVSATEREITTLNEFKQTLIANAVTGKIKI